MTPLLLESFFGSRHDNALTAKFGWCVADAIRLCNALIVSLRTSPGRLWKEDLLRTGLGETKLDAMLKRFAHQKGQVNAAYISPLEANKADLMFRPLIEGENGSYISPATSLVGPAMYEVVAAAMREVLSEDDVPELTGHGTEQAVAALLRFNATWSLRTKRTFCS